MKDSPYFQDGEFTWPKGYTAVRKFTSVTGILLLVLLTVLFFFFAFWNLEFHLDTLLPVFLKFDKL